MNKITHFVTAFLLLFALQGNSQTSMKTQPDNAAGLNQYLWSFSKNISKPDEKALIDFNAIDNWRTLGYYLAVNSDGKYFAYTIDKHTGTRYWFSRQDSLVVQSTTTNWRMAFACSTQGFFSSDGRQYIFRNGSVLSFLQLGRSDSKNIKDVTSYKANGKNDWLAYQVKASDSLILQNLATGKERSFATIAEYSFDNSSGYLVCKNNRKELVVYNPATGKEIQFPGALDYAFSGNGKSIVVRTTTAMQYISLAVGEVKTIYTLKEKASIGAYSLDAAGNQVVFNIVDSSDDAKTGIWYYEAGMDKGVLKISNQTQGIPFGFTLANASLTDNGKYIQFSLHGAPVSAKPKDDMAGVEVWNSKDVDLQSVQSKHLKDVAGYNAIANIETGKIVFVESSNKRLAQLRGDFALVKTDYRENQGDRFWESGKYKDSAWIVNLKDGSNHLLPAKSAENIWFSPDGGWLVYFDKTKGYHFYSYNLHSGELKNISATVPDNQLGITGGSDDEQAPATGRVAAWIEGQTTVLVYDSYDIWKLDLTGKQAAINITNGFGQLNSTILKLLSINTFSNEIPIIKANDALVLKAFNPTTKENGFYKKANLDSGTPSKLFMGGYFFSKLPEHHDDNLSKDGMEPMKATNTAIWIVQRQSDTDAPNYYATTDFKNFRRLTNLQPHAQYRWMTQELVSFIHLDGKTGQGILYKPENFDPAKKYPVVIAFYGQFSNNMYQFRDPNYFDQPMQNGKSPAWLLSNGFLVFTPDIAVAPLKYGPKAFSVIEGAAQYLKTLPYVDGNKLGCGGSHSWSAKLGAYIFTHSTSFNATAISEGYIYANVLSMAFSDEDGNGNNRLQGVEQGQQYGSLWENKQEWLDQTTILNADKATSPLLLYCNTEGSQAYQDQTFQFFSALRRLDKKVWWLKYDNGDHTLHDVKELRDYTIRFTQFFDHYLKNAPAPQWMTQGIPYKLKGIESRYELDPQGTCNATNGEPCPICEAWNKQYARTPEMFKKEIKDWSLDKDIAEEMERKQNERRKELDKLGEIQTKQVMEMLKK